MGTSYETIVYEVDDPVATISLNRPERLNAWNRTMARELKKAVSDAVSDRRVVGIVLTGSGKAFCSGGDLKDLTVDDLRALKPADDDETPTAGLAYFMEAPKPIIAAINGAAVGMGAVLALWTDMRFMSEEAMITMAFSQRGTVAESGSSSLLSRLVGPSAALDLLLSSRRVRSDEALAMGLINRSVPADQLLKVAREYVVAMADNCSPTSLATIKTQVYDEINSGLPEIVRNSMTLLAAAVDSPDIAEGWKAFLEKRPAKFARIGAD